MANTYPPTKGPTASSEPSESTALLGDHERGRSSAVLYTSSTASHASPGSSVDKIPASEIPSATDGDRETLDRVALFRIVLILLPGNSEGITPPFVFVKS
jgi:hypothetical protein